MDCWISGQDLLDKDVSTNFWDKGYCFGVSDCSQHKQSLQYLHCSWTNISLFCNEATATLIDIFTKLPLSPVFLHYPFQSFAFKEFSCCLVTPLNPPLRGLFYPVIDGKHTHGWSIFLQAFLVVAVVLPNFFVVTISFRKSMQQRTNNVRWGFGIL